MRTCGNPKLSSIPPTSYSFRQSFYKACSRPDSSTRKLTDHSDAWPKRKPSQVGLFPYRPQGILLVPDPKIRVLPLPGRSTLQYTVQSPHQIFRLEILGFHGYADLSRWGVSEIADISSIATGFGIPFALAGKMAPASRSKTLLTAAFSLANVQELIRRSGTWWA